MVLKSLVFAAVNLAFRTVEHTYIWTFRNSGNVRS